MKHGWIGLAVAGVFVWAQQGVFAGDEAAAPAAPAPAATTDVDPAAPAVPAAPAAVAPATPAPVAPAVEAPKVEKVRKPVAPLADVTVTGKVTKEEKQDKKGNMVTHYILTDMDGNKVTLPMSKRAKAEDAAAVSVNPANYVDQTVTVAGKGTVAENKKTGKKTTKIQSITSITKVEEKNTVL